MDKQKKVGAAFAAALVALGITGVVTIDTDTGEISPAVEMSCERATEVVNGALRSNVVRELTAEEERAATVLEGCPAVVKEPETDPFAPFRQRFADAPRTKRSPIIKECAESIGGNTKANKDRCREALR